MAQIPTVSIVTPTFNRAYIIEDAIKSVLSQTRSDWELLIVDDGSTDDTKAVVAKFTDPRIRYFYQANHGPCRARNQAIDRARGEWIAYLDSDNQLLPNYLSEMLDHFEAHSEAAYGIPMGRYVLELYRDGNCIACLDKSRMFPKNLTLKEVFHRTIPFEMNGFMHRRELITNHLRFDESILGLEDWDLVLQMGERYPDRFTYVPKRLYDYRQRYGLDGRAAAGSYARRVTKLEAIWNKHGQAELMEGQDWYPRMLDQWNERERQYQAGDLPPAYLYDFKEFWPAQMASAA